MSKQPHTKTVRTRMAEISLGSDGVLRVATNPGADYTLEDAQENQDASVKLTQGCKVPVLVDIRTIRSTTQEARSYYSENVAAREYLLAMGLLVGSPISQVIGNFMLGLNSPPFPTKIFTNEDSALNWLRNYVQ